MPDQRPGPCSTAAISDKGRKEVLNQYRSPSVPENKRTAFPSSHKLERILLPPFKKERLCHQVPVITYNKNSSCTYCCKNHFTHHAVSHKTQSFQRDSEAFSYIQGNTTTKATWQTNPVVNSAEIATLQQHLSSPS